MFEDESAQSNRRWQLLTIEGKVRTIDIAFTAGAPTHQRRRHDRVCPAMLPAVS